MRLIACVGIIWLSVGYFVPKDSYSKADMRAMYEYAYNKGMNYVSGYWARQIKDCFYKMEANNANNVSDTSS